MMKPFHICNPGHASRAFVQPRGFLNRLYLWCRGWRPHNYGPLWQKGRPYLAPPVVIVVGDLAMHKSSVIRAKVCT